jgi:hypothetical protein
MGVQDEPGYNRVTDRTRNFELQDEQVFRGAGRGPTPAEAAAAERVGAVSALTRENYKEMVARGAQQRGEGRIDR